MNVRVAIVEDETAAAQDLEKCLRRFEEGRDLSFQITCFPDGEAFLLQYQPRFDLIFLDIRMPKLNGMSAAERLRRTDTATPLVFVTSMVQYAVKSYDVGAVDFLVKPIAYPSFQMKMKRIMRAVEARQDQSLLISADGVAQVVKTSELYYAEVSNHSLTYHTAQGLYTCRGRLGDLESRLPAGCFFRVSSSCIVNLRYVSRVFQEDLEIQGALIRISRAKKKDFLAALAACIGKGGMEP